MSLGWKTRRVVREFWQNALQAAFIWLMTKLLSLNICVEQSQPTCTLKSMGGMQPTSALPRGCEQELVVIGIFSLVSRCRSLDHYHSQNRQLSNSLQTFSDLRVSPWNDGPSQLACHVRRFSVVWIPLPHLHSPGAGYLEAASHLRLWDFLLKYLQSEIFLEVRFSSTFWPSMTWFSWAVGGSLLFSCSSRMVLRGLSSIDISHQTKFFLKNVLCANTIIHLTCKALMATFWVTRGWPWTSQAWRHRVLVSHSMVIRPKFSPT